MYFSLKVIKEVFFKKKFFINEIKIKVRDQKSKT